MGKKRIIKCDGCGKEMTIGKSKYYNRSGYCGVYCSLECYLEAYGDEIEHGTLTLEKALDCSCDIYEDTPIVEKTVTITEGGRHKLSSEEIEKLHEKVYGY